MRRVMRTVIVVFRLNIKIITIKNKGFKMVSGSSDKIG